MLNNILGCVLMLTINTVWKRISKAIHYSHGSWAPFPHSCLKAMLAKNHELFSPNAQNVMSVLGSRNARVRQELLSYSMIVPGYNVYSNTSGKKVHVTHSCSHEQKRRKRLQQSYLHSVHGRIGATVDSVWRLPGHFGLAKNHAPFPPNVM